MLLNLWFWLTRLSLTVALCKLVLSSKIELCAFRFLRCDTQSKPYCACPINAILRIPSQCHTAHTQSMPYCTYPINATLRTPNQCHTAHTQSVPYCAHPINAILRREILFCLLIKFLFYAEVFQKIIICKFCFHWIWPKILAGIKSSFHHSFIARDISIQN